MILEENPLAGKADWKNDLSIAPIGPIFMYLEVYYLSMNLTSTLCILLHKNGQSAKGVVGLSYNILRGWSSSIYPNSRILIVNP